MDYECFNKEIGKKVADELLGINAIQLSPDQPFTWASGWKSPIYCDNRKSLSYPRVRTFIKDLLVKLIKEKYHDADGIAGVATAGIPQGVLVAEALELPFIYIRSKSKAHGLNNQIEGDVTQLKKVVVVEDLVSTGGSSLAAVAALRIENIEVAGMAAIFTYGFLQAENNFRDHDVSLFYLSEYELLLELALEKEQINEAVKATLDEWRNAPENWKP
jgi:orotate phosphoribosyltransferase